MPANRGQGSNTPQAEAVGQVSKVQLLHMEDALHVRWIGRVRTHARAEGLARQARQAVPACHDFHQPVLQRKAGACIPPVLLARLRVPETRGTPIGTPKRVSKRVRPS